MKPYKNKVFAKNVHFCFDFLVTKKEGKFKQTKIMCTKSFQTKSNRNTTLVQAEFSELQYPICMK